MKHVHTAAAALALAIAGTTGALADSQQLAASAGLTAAEASSMTLTEIAAVKFNAGTRPDDWQPVVRSRSGAVDPATHGQLIAAAGMTPAEAEGLTLSELAAAKSNRGTRPDDRHAAVSSRGMAAGSDTARSQLIAMAGEEGADMTLTELYVAKINRDNGRDNRQGNY